MNDSATSTDIATAPKPSRALRRIILALVVIVVIRFLVFSLVEASAEGHNASLPGLAAVLFATIAPLLCVVLGLFSLLVCVARLFRRAPGRFTALLTCGLCGAVAYWLMTLIPH